MKLPWLLSLVLAVPSFAQPKLAAPGRPGYKPPFKAASAAQMGAMHQVMALDSMTSADYPLRGFLEGVNATPKTSQHAYGALLSHLPADYFTRTAAMTNPRYNGARRGAEELQAQLAEAYERAKPEVRAALEERVSALAAQVAAGKAGRAELDEALAALAPFRAFGESAAPALRNLRELSKAVAAGQIGAKRARALAEQLAASPSEASAETVGFFLPYLGAGARITSKGIELGEVSAAAARDGLAAGDVIFKADGLDLTGPGALRALDGVLQNGRSGRVLLEVRRNDGGLSRLSILPGESVFSEGAARKLSRLAPNSEVLTALGFAVDTASKEGLRITVVSNASPAMNAGLKPGDVVARVGRRPLLRIGEEGRRELIDILKPNAKGEISIGLRRADGNEYSHTLRPLAGKLGVRAPEAERVSAADAGSAPAIGLIGAAGALGAFSAAALKLAALASDAPVPAQEMFLVMLTATIGLAAVSAGLLGAGFRSLGELFAGRPSRADRRWPHIFGAMIGAAAVVVLGPFSGLIGLSGAIGMAILSAATLGNFLLFFLRR